MDTYLAAVYGHSLDRTVESESTDSPKGKLHSVTEGDVLIHMSAYSQYTASQAEVDFGDFKIVGIERDGRSFAQRHKIKPGTAVDVLVLDLDRQFEFDVYAVHGPIGGETRRFLGLRLIGHRRRGAERRKGGTARQ